VSTDEPRKQERARAIVARGFAEGCYAVSSQFLKELYVNITRRGSSSPRRWCRGDTRALLERRGSPPTPLAAWGYRDLGSWRVCEEKLLERRPRRVLEPPPLLDRNQNGGLYALLGDDLRTFVEACLQHSLGADLSRLNPI
jgi:hypothetical protein